MLVNFGGHTVVADRTGVSTSFFVDLVRFDTFRTIEGFLDVQDTLIFGVNCIRHLRPELLVNVGRVAC